MRNTIALVLAGGQGKRMGKLCYERPKPTLPFAGTYRVIDFALSNCLNSQICNIAVLTDYQRSYMASYLEPWRIKLDNHGVHMDILAARSHYLGTADAVYQNLEYLAEQGAETLLVLAADHVYKMDYSLMLSFHKQMKAEATVGVVSVDPGQARRFGAVTVADNGRIFEFAEKAEMPQSNLVSMGIYIFDVKTIAEHLARDAGRPDSVHDFGHSIMAGVVERDRVFAYQFNGYWRDVGTIEAYYSANMELACQRPVFSVDGVWPIATVPCDLPQPKLFSQATIRNSIVSPGCIIKGHVENSVVSPGAWVDEHAVVRDSVLMGNVFIGQHSTVESCIVDEGVSVGRFCHIGLPRLPSLLRERIAVVGKDTVIPSHTIVGDGGIAEHAADIHLPTLSYAAPR